MNWEALWYAIAGGAIGGLIASVLVTLFLQRHEIRRRYYARKLERARKILHPDIPEGEIEEDIVPLQQEPILLPSVWEDDGYRDPMRYWAESQVDFEDPPPPARERPRRPRPERPGGQTEF